MGKEYPRAIRFHWGTAKRQQWQQLRNQWSIRYVALSERWTPQPGGAKLPSELNSTIRGRIGTTHGDKNASVN
jgi:hypothetical protein